MSVWRYWLGWLALRGCGGLDKAAPTFFAGIVTGIFASLSFLVMTIIDGLFFSLPDIGLVLLVVVVAGCAVGVVLLWPLSYLCSLVGLKVAQSQLWARNCFGWAVSGASMGGILLGALALAQKEPLQLLIFAAYGAVCGLVAGILCHRWIGVESLFAVDAHPQCA